MTPTAPHWHRGHMTALAVLAALAAAAAFTLAGFVAADREHRVAAKKELDEARAKWAEETAKIAAVHNDLVKRVGEITDTLNAHEMRLNGKPVAKTPAWAGG